MNKESGPPRTVKQRNDLRQILHPPASDLRSYLIETDSPFSQLSTLAGDDIFVKDIQPARRAAIFLKMSGAQGGPPLQSPSG